MTKRKSPETAEETAAAAANPSSTPQEREPEEPKRKSSWEPRSTIAVPLADGSVARYIDGYNSGGVDMKIEHPDPNFRPSAEVNEPLKEEHKGHNRMAWKNKRWHKEVRNNPVAERLDAEGRFEGMVKRRKEELASDSGKTSF